jgi:hypothetical protein
VPWAVLLDNRCELVVHASILPSAASRPPVGTAAGALFKK